jgi:site-specific DNA-adenine methylase
MSEFGLPYMGSKRKLASNIVNLILELNPKCKYFYDLFGGGGAISFEALQKPKIATIIPKFSRGFSY